MSHKIEDLVGKRLLIGTGRRGDEVNELLVLEVSASKRFARVLRPGEEVPFWMEASNIAIIEVLENTLKWDSSKALGLRPPFPPGTRLIRGDYSQPRQTRTPPHIDPSNPSVNG